MADELQNLVDQWHTGVLSRREFVRQVMALGLSMTAIAPLLISSSAGDAEAMSERKELSGTITFMKGPHSAKEKQFEAQIIRDFNKKYPKVKVNFTEYDWAQMNAQLQTAFASGSPPDVLYLVDMVYPFYAQNGDLEDMTPYVNEASFKRERSAIEPFAWKLATRQGKVWGIPVLGAVYIIVVNDDLIEKAGVTNWDKSYSAMAAAARKMTQHGVYGFSMRTRLQDYAYWDWFPYIHNAGGDILNSTWTSSGLNNADVVKAMQFLIDMHQKYKVTPPFSYDWEGQKALFKAGRIAIHHDETTFIQELEASPPKFKWSVAMVPPGPKKHTVMGNFGFLTMSKASKNKDAAWAFIKFWASAHEVTRFAQEVDLQVVLKKVPSNMWKHNKPMAQVQQHFVPRVQGIQPHPKMQQILTTFWPTIEAAYHGEYDGAQAIKLASSQIDSVLKG